MLKRTLVASLLCIVMVGCASSNKSNSLYDPLEVNALQGKHWLSMNLKREGVIETESGLQYKILESSDGCLIDPSFKITVHYQMVSVKSKEIIDSSYQRGTPSKFKLSKMIKGWREGVPLMKVGETWELYLPSDLAYGTNGLPGSVAPNSVLISQIKLIDARCDK